MPVVSFEQYDRAVDMIEKVTQLAIEKGTTLQQIFASLNYQLKHEYLFENADAEIPDLERNLLIAFSKLMHGDF